MDFHALAQDEPVREVVISTSTGQAVFPGEIAYVVTCGSFRYEIAFAFQGREWSGLSVNGVAIDLDAQAAVGYQDGTISDLVGYGRCEGGEEHLAGLLFSWETPERTVRYRVRLGDEPALSVF